MSNWYLIFVVISLASGATSFIATNNIICGSAVLILNLLFFFFIALNQIKKYFLKMRRLNCCYDFINTFILSLSSQNSISYSYSVSYLMLDKDIKSLMETVSNQSDKENLKYLLENVFPFDIYRLFINILNIWEQEGGDIINMSLHLITEARNLLEMYNSIKNSAKKNIVEFGILWFITFIILIVLRFSLVNFYDKVINQPLFLIAVVLVFVFFIASVEIFIIRVTKTKIRGWKDNEKHY